MNLEECLRNLPKNKKIYYMPNPGNAGDSLIAVGTFDLFDKLGIEVEVIVEPGIDLTGSVLILSGGGNFTEIYGDIRSFVEFYHNKVDRLILLPHTVQGNADLICQLGENSTLFAREMVSYEYLRKLKTRAGIYCDHDLAFSANITSLLDFKGISICEAILKKSILKLFNSEKARDIPSIKLMIKNDLFEKANDKKVNQMTFFRKDIESLGLEARSLNYDISNMYMYGTHSKYINYYAASKFVSMINKCDEINTDRLHVCIAAAMLGKSVNFYPNSYYKCEAVYNYSIKSKFPNVRWMG